VSKNSREYMPTFALIAANVGVYAFTAILSMDPVTTSGDILYTFGQVNSLVMDGQVWRLFTAMFVHANVEHIFGNMLFLLIFGLRAEDMFDIKEYLLVYFLSGLFGGLLTLLWPVDMLSVGASGAIFGVLGATLVYARRSIGQSIISALMFAFFLLIISVGGNVNILAHIGGLATGLLVGYSVAAFRRPKPKVKQEYTYPSSWGKAGY